MSITVAGTILVAGSHWFGITASETEGLWGRVTITVDGRSQWVFQEPVWRPIAVGCGPESTFMWSAREVIRLPESGDDAPEIVARADEDVLLVFEHEHGWVLVCESSVLRVCGGKETARWELPGVVVGAAWRGTELAVLSEGGGEVLLEVAGTGLICRD